MNDTLTKFDEISSVYGAKNLSKNVLLTQLGYNTRFNYNFIKIKSVEHVSNVINNSLVGKNLQELIDLDIHYMSIKNTYKGLRHKASLPVRGQRTHTNAKTCKKKRRQKV